MTFSRWTLAQLTAELRPGLRVYVPGTAGEPTAWLDSLARDPERARGVHFVTNYIPGINEFDFLERYPESRLTCFFMQDRLRPFATSERLSVVPITYYEIDAFLASQIELDLAVAVVSPPDAQGHCSLGTSVDFSPTALARARRLVALCNPHMPFLRHSPSIPLDSFDGVIDADFDLRYVATPAGDANGEAIARHVASLVHDGDSIQIGIGKLPAQVLRALTSHRKLRLHSGFLTQEVAELFEAGAMDRAHRAVGCSFSADRDFLQRSDYRDWLEVRPVSYTHNPRTLQGIEQLVAINSAVEVDLRGNVNGEVAGGRTISGPGGMPDFAWAAHQAPRGQAIIALPATTPGQKASRIVAGFGARSTATLARTMVDAVVTEFGVARLRGRSERERAEALIGIAHPTFQESLRAGFFA